jgi:hypothetical protein
MIVAIPIILWRLLFLKSNTGQYHDKQRNGNRDQREVNRRRRLTSEINQRCKYRYSKYCRDGKEANIFYYITILKSALYGKRLEQHMLLSISKAILQVECGPLFQ